MIKILYSFLILIYTQILVFSTDVDVDEDENFVVGDVNQFCLDHDDHTYLKYKTEPEKGEINPPFDLHASNITDSQFELHWRLLYGEFASYVIHVEEGNTKYPLPSYCFIPPRPPQIIIIPITSVTKYLIDSLIPYQDVTVKIAIKYPDVIGPWSDPLIVTTLSKEPSPVGNITLKFVEDRVIFSWLHPCYSYGDVVKFTISGVGHKILHERHEFTEDLIVSQVQDSYKLGVRNIKTDFDYSVTIQAFIRQIDKGGELAYYSFRGPSLIPPEPDKYLKLNPESETPTRVSIQLFEFNVENGTIIYYSVLVGEEGYINSTSSWISANKQWPQEKTWQQANEESIVKKYQATKKKWNPFKNLEGTNKNYKYIIGADGEICQKLQNNSIYCNGPLKPSTKYGVILRAFTDRGYRDSQVFYFITDAEENTYTILMAVGSVTVIGSIVAFSYIFVIRRRKQWQMERKKQNKLNIDLNGVTAELDGTEQPESHQLFDIAAVNEEYDKLQKNTKKIHHHSTCGTDEQNKEKNRYANVFPFDYNRVLLPGQPSENYINASHINGFDDVQKYIATQGPKENTAKDFWAMVASCNVSSIVMLCKTVEQKKVKCDFYYPEAGMSKLLGDYSVHCIQRHSYKTFIIRDLVLVKDGDKHNITHFQYLEWADFGVPSSVKEILKFCDLVEKSINPLDRSVPLVVHCR
ncbi:tyrosine-protein phosphatase 10D-like isoform X2 [Cimex lectularius]|uniref:protein-tyrosine-phosphatase n=1 Tax=Cimex lectularius TaxID=79782 RepID=A0A8I6RSL5_CIMLE|nr:tyrosine-protein phosphatase 10D-like isoform X2 [Cimex lectularius]